MKKKLFIVSFFSLFSHTQVFDSNNYIPAVDDAFIITAELENQNILVNFKLCLLYTSPSPRDTG